MKAEVVDSGPHEPCWLSTKTKSTPQPVRISAAIGEPSETAKPNAGLPSTSFCLVALTFTCAPPLVTVRGRRGGDDARERQLPGAVAADEAAGLDLLPRGSQAPAEVDGELAAWVEVAAARR